MPEKPRFNPLREKRVEPLNSALRLSDVEEGSSENPEDRLIEHLDAGKFLDFLKKHLDERKFAILVGYIVEGKTLKELGTQFDISVSRVQQIYQDAVKTAKHDFSTARQYYVKNEKPKEVIYENVSDVDDSREKEEGRRKLDELARLLLGEENE